MGLSFLIVLMGLYLVLGLTVRRYTPQTRLLLIGVTVAVPGFSYFFW